MWGYSMELYVLDSNYNRIGIIDNFISLIWNTKYYEPGEFELYIAADLEVVEELTPDNFLVRTDKEDEAMVIEEIKLEASYEDGDKLLVKGRCLKSFLYRRIIWDYTNAVGRMPTIINNLIRSNLITPRDANRHITMAISGQVPGTDMMSAQYHGQNLGETVTELLKSINVGWVVKLVNKVPTIFFYKGTDRSARQNEHPVMLFSPDRDNLISSTYIYSNLNYKNVANVAGEGEGANRRCWDVGNSRGLNRYELFVDARDISSDEGTIGEADYNNLLRARGLEKLTNPTNEFNGEIVDENNLFGVDYNLGDVVEIRNEYGMRARSRIVEIICSEDASGYYVIPYFEKLEG